MSDKWITLSCGYWKDARNLDEAQEAKLDLVCRKIGLSNGDGCWISAVASDRSRASPPSAMAAR